MPADNTHSSTSITFANEIIELANKRIMAGEPVEDVALGIRQATGNFSAYAFVRLDDPDKDPNTIVDEFVQLFQYYLDVHSKPDEPSSAASNLQALVEQAKKELK